MHEHHGMIAGADVDVVEPASSDELVTLVGRPVDVSGDCAHPRLVSTTDLSPAYGHEGWFSPDGMTYYMSSTGPDGAATVHPIDIADTAHPKLLASWAFPSQTHGGSTTEDGTRSYICQQQAPPKDKLWVVDTSSVASRAHDPQPRMLARARRALRPIPYTAVPEPEPQPNRPGP